MVSPGGQPRLWSDWTDAPGHSPAFNFVGFIIRGSFRPPDKSAYLKIIFLICQPKHIVCCRYSKEPSQIEHPKHMFKLMGKEKKCNFRCTNNPYLDLCHCLCESHNLSEGQYSFLMKSILSEPNLPFES